MYVEYILRWRDEAYMTPPGASARDLFHVGVKRMVGYLGGHVPIARERKRFRLGAIEPCPVAEIPTASPIRQNSRHGIKRAA